MLEGIKEDIVCLPVHDAIAVQQQHQHWAKEVMLETWQAHLDGVRTKVPDHTHHHNLAQQTSKPNHLTDQSYL